MEAKVEAVSYRKNGVKINGVWYNAVQEAVQTALKSVNKGDTVEYSTQEKDLTFIKVTQAYNRSAGAPQQKQGDLSRVPEKVSNELDLDKLMEESIDTVVGKALEKDDNGELKIPEKLGETIEWGKLIISLFIGKTRQI